MIGMAKKIAQVVFGNRVFQVPSRPYVGEDSVLRLGPVDYRRWVNDIAGGGHIAGYPVWQGAPSNIALMGPMADAVGGGLDAGFGTQPGQLAAAPAPPSSGSGS